MSGLTDTHIAEAGCRRASESINELVDSTTASMTVREVVPRAYLAGFNDGCRVGSSAPEELLLSLQVTRGGSTVRRNDFCRCCVIPPQPWVWGHEHMASDRFGYGVYSRYGCVRIGDVPRCAARRWMAETIKSKGESE